MESPVGRTPPPQSGPTGSAGSAGSAAAGTPAGRGTPVLLPEGWVATVTDRIVSTVDRVRAKTTVPIEKAGRAVIWGLLIATAGAGLLIALTIGLLRVVYEAVALIPGISGREGRSVWITDVTLGVGLILLGLYFIAKGTKPQPKD